MIFVPAAVASVITVISAGVVKRVAEGVIFFIALKILLTGLFIVALPIILNNFLYDLIDIGLGFMDGMDSDGFSAGMEFAGFLGWLVERFKIPECIAVLVSAMQARIVLKMIPFSPVR